MLETAISHAVNGDVILKVLHLNTDVRISVEGTGAEPIKQIAADETGQSIGKAIIEQMKGTYSRDLLQNGIRFNITLPFGGYEEVLKDNEMNVIWNKQTPFNENLPKLLIVEDDVIHAEVLQTLLQSQYFIEVVHCPEEALTIIQQKT